MNIPSTVPCFTLIATGNEILEGRVVNTNTTHIARLLDETGYRLNKHIIVSDDTNDIEQALAAALLDSQAVVVVGGLGPTSDDRTRFAVANCCQQELVLDMPSLAHIQHRLNQLQLELTPNNRIQAMLPQTATAFTNEHGSAPGFGLIHQGIPIAVLPGPPSECLPMAHQSMLPFFKRHLEAGDFIIFRWKLLGSVESHLAKLLDPILAANDLEGSYCWNYPYTDFSIKVVKEDAHKVPVTSIEQLISPYFVTHTQKTASQLLQEKLMDTGLRLHIDDTATGGKFYASLCNPKIRNVLIPFCGGSLTSQSVLIRIQGLERYWRGEQFGAHETVEIEIHHQQQTERFKSTIPLSGARVCDFASEFACFSLLRYLHL